MSFIVERYNFNVPQFKTQINNGYEAAKRGGLCKRECSKCKAFNVTCKGCNFRLCTEKYCNAKHCNRCATMCYRASDRIEEAVDFINGFEINKTQTKDTPFLFDVENSFIPAIQKRIGKTINSKVISIPFYAIFDFEKEKPFCDDIRSFFKIKDGVEIIINFYMKDDKISTLFEYMVGEKFIRIIKGYKGVSYWHTPCFSVFDVSSSMDQVLNWKRQWWIGDLMRGHGLNIIQECLYSVTKEKYIDANIENALEIIDRKQIKNIGQNLQLDPSNPTINAREILDFHRKLPDDVTLLLTGISENRFQPVKMVHENSYFCNYSLQYNKERRTYG